MIRLVLLVAIVLSVGATQFKVASIFGDGVVLQRDQAVVVWGWSQPDTAVSAALSNPDLQLSFTASAVSDPTGRWAVTFPAQKASLGWQFVAATSDTDFERCTKFAFYCGGASVEIINIAFGDVIMCIGQSNMQASFVLFCLCFVLLYFDF